MVKGLSGNSKTGGAGTRLSRLVFWLSMILTDARLILPILIAVRHVRHRP